MGDHARPEAALPSTEAVASALWPKAAGTPLASVGAQHPVEADPFLRRPSGTPVAPAIPGPAKGAVVVGKPLNEASFKLALIRYGKTEPLPIESAAPRLYERLRRYRVSNQAT